MTSRPALTLVSSSSAAAMKGDLAQTKITDIMQFLSSSYGQGMIQVTGGPDGHEGKIYFMSGALLHVETGAAAGLDGLVEMLTWTEGSFQFHPGATAPDTNIGLSIQHAIMEAAMRLDHRGSGSRSGTASIANQLIHTEDDERSNEMQQQRESTEVLNDLLGIPGIDAVVVIGRDGFVIESAGNSARVNIDALGASLAHAVNGIEEMGSELKINQFQDMFVEYGRAVILCKPMGDAVAAVITPDASKLGIIRHKTKKYFEELAHSF